MKFAESLATQTLLLMASMTVRYPHCFPPPSDLRFDPALNCFDSCYMRPLRLVHGRHLGRWGSRCLVREPRREGEWTLEGTLHWKECRYAPFEECVVVGFLLCFLLAPAQLIYFRQIPPPPLHQPDISRAPDRIQIMAIPIVVKSKDLTSPTDVLIYSSPPQNNVGGGVWNCEVAFSCFRLVHEVVGSCLNCSFVVVIIKSEKLK